MPNYNPLTNAVGGNNATVPQLYYNVNPTNFGEYGFVYLSEIVTNFTATYTGTGKILANVLKADINFHAHRALQELSYDTLVSSKSQEIEVCPSLMMPLPHDYVNYVKLTSVDSNGIEHVIYPTRHTSNPFAIQQSDGCVYDMNVDGTIKHQEDCAADTLVECDATDLNLWMTAFVGKFATTAYGLTLDGSQVKDFDSGVITNFPYSFVLNSVNYTVQTIEEIYQIITGLVDTYCNCVNAVPLSPYTCGTKVTTGWTLPSFASAQAGDIDLASGITYSAWWLAGAPLAYGWTGDPWSFAHLNSWPAPYSADGNEWSFNDISGISTGECTLFSNAWNNYSTSSGTSTGVTDALNPATDNSNYFTNEGKRYGLEPEHSQVNGSYFIDHLRGNIHFGSALAGKTIILKYISDGHGTDDEMMVPKMAEEAMYKWIAYGCAQARSDVDQGTIARFKQERKAETRKAKLRLSNIKLEEISQVLRGKSKWIKH